MDRTSFNNIFNSSENAFLLNATNSMSLLQDIQKVLLHGDHHVSDM